MWMLAIDPGPKKSGIVSYYGKTKFFTDVGENDKVLAVCAEPIHEYLAYEAFANYGSHLGKDSFETLTWTGRFIQRSLDRHWMQAMPGRIRIVPVYRMDCKKFLLNSHKGADKDIRAALIERLGPIGTKKEPGPLFGVKSHAWAALAVAVTAEDMIRNPEPWGYDGTWLEWGKSWKEPGP